MLVSACGPGETEDKETEAKDHETEVVEDTQVEEEIMNEEDPEDYADYSIDGQWSDIVFQVGTGDPSNLDMYVDYGAETFSEEEWGYIDWSYPEYAETFGSFESYEDLPAADYFVEGAKVVQVYFETESDGMVFESMVMIYLVEEEGLLWIIGTEMAG